MNDGSASVRRLPRVGIVGNPNCGKSSIFNALTGARQYVGNWPGVTVERKEGELELADGRRICLVDTPGIYSLTATSEDERATFSYVMSHDAEVFVNVVDATALERNLYLTLLLGELGIPIVVAVTMTDLARERKIEIDIDHLQRHLGVPVVAVNATRSRGTDALKAAIAKAIDHPQRPTVQTAYPDEIEKAIDLLASASVKTAEALGLTRRWIAIRALEDDRFAIGELERYHDMAPEVVAGARERCMAILKDEVDVAIADARYGTIAGLVRDVVKVRGGNRDISEQLDAFALNRFLGIPVFLGIMSVVFWLTQSVGGALVEHVDRLGGTLFVDLPARMLALAHAPDWLVGLLANGAGGALQTVATFIPPVGLMFLCLSALEDSGYMARAAFVMDRFMRFIGLPGKSFVPMLVGFGCTVPAIMATRTLESKRDRLLTVFMAPFMSCGAKLPVWTLFAAAFMPESPGRMVFALYLAGIAIGIGTGLLLKHTLFQGEPTHFIMELPPYHLPRPRHILLHTWERLKIFILRAGKLIVPMVLVLGFLNTLGIDGSIGNEDGEKSVLCAVGKKITPVFEPIGVEPENWPASVSVFTGLFAKESVIGTMKGLYGQIDAHAAVRHDEQDSALSSLRRHFPRGFHQAFAFLLFILLYVPCLAATGVVFREIGKLYGTIFVVYLTGLGWSVSAMYYSAAVLGSVGRFAAAAAIPAAIFTVFWLYGRRHRIDLASVGPAAPGKVRV